MIKVQYSEAEQMIPWFKAGWQLEQRARLSEQIVYHIKQPHAVLKIGETLAQQFATYGLSDYEQDTKAIIRMIQLVIDHIDEGGTFEPTRWDEAIEAAHKLYIYLYKNGTVLGKRLGKPLADCVSAAFELKQALEAFKTMEDAVLCADIMDLNEKEMVRVKTMKRRCEKATTVVLSEMPAIFGGIRDELKESLAGFAGKSAKEMIVTLRQMRLVIRTQFQKHKKGSSEEEFQRFRKESLLVLQAVEELTHTQVELELKRYDLSEHLCIGKACSEGSLVLDELEKLPEVKKQMRGRVRMRFRV